MARLDDETTRRILRAIRKGRVKEFKVLVDEHPESLTSPFIGGCLLREVAENPADKVEFVSYLLSKGMNVDSTQFNNSPPLAGAVDAGAIKIAQLLLEAGADPNKDRNLIAAINAEKNSFELVKLLVEHGADVNATYRFGGKKGPLASPLSWAIANEEHEIAEYLRSRGAVVPEEQGVTPTRDRDGEVVAYFNEHFGRVAPQALIEIVPTKPEIAVHVIPSGDERDHITLFTNGMSSKAMKVPRGGDRDYRYAELFIQLPASFNYRAIEDPNHGWPIHWLRSMARYPHQNRTWLGGPVTIVAAEDPPQPFAPDVPSTSMLLLAERHFNTKKGRLIQLYRMFPLYTEERELEIEKGVPELMKRFDKMSIPFIVDCDRPNVAKID